MAIHQFEDFPALVSSPVFLNDKSTCSLPEELSPTKKVQESYQHKVGQFYNGKKSIHAGGFCLIPVFEAFHDSLNN